jgi:hypothetical protein
MRALRPVPRLESLEVRDCPAVSISLVSGNIFVRGVPDGDLTINAVNNNKIQIIDGTKLRGTFNVPGNINIQLTSRPGAINLDLNSKTLNGSVLMDLGNGYTGKGILPENRSVNIFDSNATTKLGTGLIGGNVNIQRGDGNELVGVGFIQASTAENRPITVRGNLTVVGRASIPFQEDFQLGEGSDVRGAVSVTNYDNVSLGLDSQTIETITTVRGNVSITTMGVGGGLFANLYGNFLRNVTVNGAASTANNNTFSLIPPTNDDDSFVGGHLNVSFGSAINGNQMSILNAVGGTAVSQIIGTTTLISNNGTAGIDDVFLEGQFNNKVVVNLGAGDNFLTVDAAATFNSSLTYNSALFNNGVNTLDIAGLVLGQLFINLGNGDNDVTITGPVNQGGPNGIVLKAGNGDNAVLLDGGDQTYSLDWLFGSGDNVVDLGPSDTISGKILAPAPFNSSTLNENGATFLPPFTTNFGTVNP